MFRLIFGLILLLIVNQGLSNDILETQQKRFETLALQLWDYAELGYLEVRSSNLLKEELKNEGFKIENNLAEIPTAFKAVYGESGPTIGILGEFDALPGLSQTNSPFKEQFGA